LIWHSCYNFLLPFLLIFSAAVVCVSQIPTLCKLFAVMFVSVEVAVVCSTFYTWFAASVQVPGGLTAMQALLSLSKLQTENNSDDGKKQVLISPSLCRLF
jgi:hypothetical protein